MYKHGREAAWFTHLGLCHVDLAAMLRAEHGLEVIDVLATVMKQLPSYVAPPQGRLLTRFGLE